jgi:hypothetical protein
MNDLKKLVAYMRAEADLFPFDPLKPVAWKKKLKKVKSHQHRVKIDDYTVIVTLTRDRLPGVLNCHEFYHLSLGNDQGDPRLIPKRVVWRLRQAFVPNGMEMPSKLGNCLQFVEPCPDESN